MSAGIRHRQTRSSVPGKSTTRARCIIRPLTIISSLNGEVKLWDLRGSDRAAQTWHIHTSGIAAFDVHPQTGIFAATSALTPTHWRDQRVTVQSLSRATPLSTFTVPSNIGGFPSNLARGEGGSSGSGGPSAYVPRMTSLAFHPMEMLYGVGGPDGTVRIMGCKFASG